MKILVTGIHSAAVRSASLKLGVRVSIGSYVAAMRDLGHHVDWRRTDPLDDPAEYDLIVCGMVPPGKMVAVDLYPALRLLARAKRAGVRTVLANDDWQTALGHTRSQARNYLENPHRIFENDFLAKRPFHDWAVDPDETERRETVLEGLRLIVEDELPWVCCAYQWGDHTVYRAETEQHVWVMDPSPYVEFPVQPDQHKTRAWIMSALFDHSGWAYKQGQFGRAEHWPVDFFTSARHLQYGVNKKAAPQKWSDREYEMPRLYKRDKVHQDQLLELQGAYRGGIIQPYRHRMGAGWWRHQWFTVPQSGAVLWCDPADRGKLDPGLFGMDAALIEMMGDQELRQLAREQRLESEGWLWSKERLQSEVGEMLRDERHHT